MANIRSLLINEPDKKCKTSIFFFTDVFQLTQLSNKIETNPTTNPTTNPIKPPSWASNRLLYPEAISGGVARCHVMQFAKTTLYR